MKAPKELNEPRRFKNVLVTLIFGKNKFVIFVTMYITLLFPVYENQEENVRFLFIFKSLT